MILIYSATLRMKFQGKFRALFDENKRAPIPAFVTTVCGRAVKQLRGGKGQQDHEKNSTLIQRYGNVPLLKRTIETPKTIQREIQS